MTEVEMPPTIASLEPSDETSSPPNPLKRRHSQESDNDVQATSNDQKRQRVNGDASCSPTEPAPVVNEGAKQELPDAAINEAHDTPQTTKGMNTLQQASPPAPPRRKLNTADEKQRSKRLFGALLGNLSRPSDTKQSTRRAEIEARRKSEIQRQDEETAAQEAMKKEERLARRRERQGDVDEEVMNVRRKNELEMARFLFTKTEPRIYWKPWELMPEEEERIAAQVADVEESIERERNEFYAARGHGGRVDEEKGRSEHQPANAERKAVESVEDGPSEATSTNTNKHKSENDDTYVEQQNSMDSEPAGQEAPKGDDSVLNKDHPDADSGPVAQPEPSTNHELEPDPELEDEGGGDGEDAVIY